MQFIAAEEPLPEHALLLANDEDVIARSAELRGHSAVALQFPKWTDGRAYSQAVLLRARVRFTGEIIATGDVVVDMLPLLHRCGFTQVQLRADQRRASAQAVMGQIEPRYQRTLAERSARA